MAENNNNKHSKPSTGTAAAFKPQEPGTRNADVPTQKKIYTEKSTLARRTNKHLPFDVTKSHRNTATKQHPNNYLMKGTMIY